MGIYDRDYFQEERRYRFGLPLGPGWRTSAVAWLIGITIGTYFLQLVLEVVLALVTPLLARSEADESVEPGV